MEQIEREKAEQLLGNLKCSKGLTCVSQGFEALCRANRMGNVEYLECMEKDQHCSFRLSFGSGFLCKCPIRIYLKQELGK